jgi:hypothetical protein
MAVDDDPSTATSPITSEAADSDRRRKHDQRHHLVRPDSRAAIQFGLVGQVGSQIIGNSTTGIEFPQPRTRSRTKRFLGTSAFPNDVCDRRCTMPEDLYISATSRS